MRVAAATAFLLLCMGKRPVLSFTVNRLSMSMSEKPTVAVIGGGIAGLSCASTLARSQQFRPVVFDTGRLRPGGRCSSRFAGDCPKDDERQHTPLLSKSLYDHAAQIITVGSNDGDEFAKQVAEWQEEGIVKRYPPDSVFEIISNEGSFSLRPINDKAMYHGAHGMGSIPLAMDKKGDFAIEQDVWVPPSSGVKYVKSKGKWKVRDYDECLFDELVIAHNGKCADRLMSKTPAKALHSLLRVNFNPTVPKWGGKRMTLNSIYSLTFCLKERSILSKTLPSLVCGFISQNSRLRFVSCQTRKYPREDDDVEVWTILSSPKFAKRHKAPQEFLPDDLVDNVTDLLLESLEELLGLNEKSLRNSVLERRLQLWGAAVPLNTYGKDGFVWDSDFHVGVCGDWLLEPSIAGAWESGRRLAEYMNSGAQHSVGLPTPEKLAVFQASKQVSKAGIGSLQ